MTKYKQYFQEMLADQKKVFDDFKKIHDLFVADRMKYQDEFNRQGEAVMDIIHDWEKRLCTRMESGKNGVYSANLSEKFKNEIKKVFPQIDFIGIKLSYK
jgi:hypothetical protein